MDDHPDGPGLLTVGHGTLAAEELVGLLRGAGVELLVDVRAVPGSRRHPHVAREEMEGWVPDSGIEYRWARQLGGRRRPVPGSRHVAIRNDSFRAYADHMETSEFRGAIDHLVGLAGDRTTAIMCSETLWWRCHRRLVADHLVLARDVAVEHLLHDGRRTPHAPTDGVRPADGGVVYDVVAGSPPLPLG